jgi:hypothetical protein
VPVGYVRDGDSIVLDPDQEVQGAVRAVFDLFQKEGTAYAVVQRFQALGLRFPRRAYGGAWDGKLVWGRLTHSRVLGLLANPSYAGVYVFGRYQSRKQVAPTGEISTVSHPVPREQWRVTIPDHHPGYITWDRFLANRHRLEANKTNGEVIGGPAREGLCLRRFSLMMRAFGSPNMPRTVPPGRKPGNAYASHSRRFRLRAAPIEKSTRFRAPLHPLESLE